ncbi:YebC/PmpR family DNA-binding transcriptional regulator [bacterium]|nr:MAG: YebC/PmpR family DNA-binding transcriptional regulator [bacterium]
MSGHSKWSTIKRKKALIDSKRSRIWTKIIREIMVAARDGGGDASNNPRLSLAIDNAKAANMPKDNIDRAIKKGTGELGGAAYEDVTYEGYGPGGIAYFVEAGTDNVNRTVGEVRHIFSKYGGNLGTNGSVAFMFNQVGVISIPSDGVDEDQLMMDALEAGAEDIKNEEEVFEVQTARENLFVVRQALEAAGYKIDSAELQRIPSTYTKVDAETALANFKLMEKLEENDDISDVFNNMEMDDETIALAENM